MSTPYPWGPGKEAPEDYVFEAVSKIYEGSAYRGTASEIKASWGRVHDALNRGEAWRYYPSKWIQFEGQLMTSDADHTT